ncbi:MAG: AraC family transcriptional regulator [Labilithrix sp.]|nr:AraC family transcriptional regulator [Labilithrix sp.]
MARSPTALAALARTAAEAATRFGLDLEPLLKKVGLSRAEIDEMDGRVESAALLRMWEVIADASGNPFFGLHIGERLVDAKTIHVVGYMAKNSRVLGDCYGRTARFARLTNEASEISLRTEGGRGVMRVGPLPGTTPWPRCYAEMALAAYLSLGRRWTGVAFHAVAVTFQHPAPRDVSEYARLFGDDVRFGAAKNELFVDASVLELPLRDPDASLSEYLDLRASALLEAIGKGGELEIILRKRIDEELVEGAPSLPRVAKRMGMSARTLQRRLSEAELSFSDIVDDVRRTAALRLIAEPKLSVFEIAAMVGYRDATSFRAAFERWTGLTPRDYRRERI